MKVRRGNADGGLLANWRILTNLSELLRSASAFEPIGNVTCGTKIGQVNDADLLCDAEQIVGYDPRMICASLVVISKDEDRPINKMLVEIAGPLARTLGRSGRYKT